ncbi:MAG: dihydroorotase family protein [Nitrospinota bacterium]
MEPVDIVIKSGTVILSEGPARVGIGVKGERIVAVAEESLLPEAREVIDIPGKTVLPGVIDMHVHFRDPGMTHKEDFTTGSLAAVAGGVTTVADMPNQIPPPTTAETFAGKLDVVGAKSYVDFALFAGGMETAEFPALAKAGACGLKLFQFRSSVKGSPYLDQLCVMNEGQLYDTFQGAAQAGLRVFLHADNPHIINPLRARLQEQGRCAQLDYHELRNSVATREAVDKAILFAEKTGVRLHFVHISLCTLDCLDSIRAARARGLPITCESVQPFLSYEDHERLGPYALPFALPPSEIEAYWSALANGDIDGIGTDHAPHTIQEKEPGRKDVWSCPPGFPAVETSLPLTLTKCAEGGLTLTRLAELMSAGPAKLLGLYPRKGAIRVGSDADLTIVDYPVEEVIDQKKLHSKCGWSPFDGWTVRGVPVMTILRGKVVMRDGEITGAPGDGRFVSPGYGEDGSSGSSKK